MQLVIFYVFAAVLLFAATMVITSKNPVYAALYLVLAFFNAAALWLMAEAEFLGVALVLIYVGAVMVMFLFVVMMLDINIEAMREGFARYLPIGAAVALVMVLELVLVVGSAQFQVPPVGVAEQAAGGSNIEAIGAVLYTDYVYAFELAAVVLLLAIIAAIMLTHRERGGTRRQDPAKQVRVRKGDRLRVLKMDSEPSRTQDRVGVAQDTEVK
jgi:NADH-quinone oxidoreductase subunit J